jgi:hypothetical protein
MGMVPEWCGRLQHTHMWNVLHQGVYQTMGESMSAYKPRKDKLGGLPNITYIHCKPKPLGRSWRLCATVQPA